MQVGEPVARLARELEVGPGELYRWYHEQEKLGAGAFMGSGHKQAEADRVAELERKIGQQALEIDFLKRALQRVEETGASYLEVVANGIASQKYYIAIE